MPSKEELISLISALFGAILGAYFAGPFGAGLGAIIVWSIPIVSRQFMEDYRIKRRILNVLKLPKLMQVKEIMLKNGIMVPTDCFIYDNNHPFIVSLTKYRKALLELEIENKVVYNEQASVEHGYVDHPYEWVNQWSGRAYQIVQKDQ